MNTLLLRWWKNITSVVNNPAWEGIRAGYEKKLPSILIRMSSKSFFVKKMISIAGAFANFRYFDPNSNGRIGDIVYCAPTLNNKKSISRFEILCPSHKDGVINRFKSVCFFIRSLFETIYSISGLKIPNNTNIVTFVMLAQYIQSYLYFKALLRSVSAKGALIANDHSPFQCGFVAAAQFHGLKTIYIQHAHVTSIFPPLKFDVSLLYGQHAQDIYAAKRREGGKIILVGSGRVGCLTTGDMRLPPVLTTVGVALTNLPPTGYLRELINRIKSLNPCIRIFLRAHPRTNPKDLADLANYAEVRLGTSVAEDANIADVFICGNSSVALELLKYGVPVAVSSYLDNAPEDYYGFIRYGVVPRADPVDNDWWLRVGLHYNKYWHKNAEYFDVSFSKADEEISLSLNRVLDNVIFSGKGGSGKDV